MRLKIVPQFQNYQKDVAKLIDGPLGRGISSVLYIQPPKRREQEDLFPGKIIRGRPWIGGDDVEREYIWRGAKGAEEYFKRVKAEWYDRCPYVKRWQTPNEPHPMYDADFCLQLVKFLTRLTVLMKGEGLEVEAGHFSVWWPRLDQMKMMVSALYEADVVGMHCYNAPKLFSRGPHGEHPDQTLLWYRTFANVFYAETKRWPRMVICETGVDHGTYGGALGGWQKTPGYSEAEYASDLLKLNEEYNKDAYVEQGDLFVAGPGDDWKARGFEVTPGLYRRILEVADTFDNAPDAPGSGPVSKNLTKLAYERLNIPYNENAALQRVATKYKLGVPVTPEFEAPGMDGRPAVYQVYSTALVWSYIGEWADSQVKVYYI